MLAFSWWETDNLKKHTKYVNSAVYYECYGKKKKQKNRPATPVAENHTTLELSGFEQTFITICSAGRFLLGVFHVFAVRWQLEQESSEGSTEMDVPGSFLRTSGASRGMAPTAGGWRSISVFSCSLSLWLAYSSSQHSDLTVVRPLLQQLSSPTVSIPSDQDRSCKPSSDVGLVLPCHFCL